MRKPKLRGTSLGVIQHNCIYGLEYFCDGTPNKSRLKAGIEYEKRNPCKFLNGDCPVRNNALSKGIKEAIELRKEMMNENTTRVSRNTDFSSRNFSEALIKHRNKKRLTREDLAEAVGVGAWTVKMWESGQVKPRGKNLKKLEEMFETVF